MVCDNTADSVVPKSFVLCSRSSQNGVFCRARHARLSFQGVHGAPYDGRTYFESYTAIAQLIFKNAATIN